MKIIHCADLHLDSKMTANLSREQARERRKELLRTFTRMVEYAAANEVRVILIAGDLFDTRNISAMARNTVRDMILGHPQIDFIYLRGNHDSDNFLTKLEEVPENLLMYGDSWGTYLYGDVAITGMEISPDNAATMYNSIVLEHDKFNIVTLHGQLENYKSKDQVQVISLNDLKNKNIDYLALGHVHGRLIEKLDARGIYCYPGCLEGRGFDECGEKGFMLLDIDEDSRTMNCEFVPFAARTIYTLPVDVGGVMTTQEAAERIERAISDANYSSGSLVKIELTGEVEVDAEFSCDFLEDMFSDYFYYEKVEDRTRLRVNYADYEKDASLKGEFIRMVLSSDMSEEEKTEVIRCGIMALSGEEI
ncbi:MAG: metallophosphoesterase [Clostridiales bacterium]|nr:metallophosphoesterase [Clostridiales bacterium]